jgi:hypothetical protein
MIAYIEIENYKTAKKKFYENTLSKICTYELNGVNKIGGAWINTKKAI